MGSRSTLDELMGSISTLDELIGYLSTLDELMGSLYLEMKIAWGLRECKLQCNYTAQSEIRFKRKEVNQM